MKNYLKLAWRNLWRNKRRTLITVASIFFAVFFAAIMRSFQLGTYSHMIKLSIESFSGYLQVQNPKYFDEPSIDFSLDYNEDLIKQINSVNGIKSTVPQITNFSFASFEEQSKGIIVIGIDPEKEKTASNPEHHLIHYRFSPESIDKIKSSNHLSNKQLKLLSDYTNSSFKSIKAIQQAMNLDEKEDAEIISIIEKETRFNGNYLHDNDDGVLITDRLSKYLKINVGDTLVLMGQGYHGASAAGLFPVRGIIKVPSPDLDNKLVYMALPRAQEYFGMPGMISYLSINLVNPDNMLSIQKQLQNLINNNNYSVKNWEEINPVLLQQIQGDSVSGQIMIGILYLIVFFGIFGTIIMMVAERKREFGVLIAIGMSKIKLTIILIFEMLIIGLISIISGLLASAPVILLGYYFPIRLTGEMAKMMEDYGWDPIMPMEWFDNYFYNQAWIVIAMVLIVCYIPFQRIRKMKVANALHA
ncbi:MAG: ABC transporter permease [Bacteroidales bacterium]|nr:ABC transporter permease [Bacteroidales bacterium]